MDTRIDTGLCVVMCWLWLQTRLVFHLQVASLINPSAQDLTEQVRSLTDDWVAWKQASEAITAAAPRCKTFGLPTSLLIDARLSACGDPLQTESPLVSQLSKSSPTIEIIKKHDAVVQQV